MSVSETELKEFILDSGLVTRGEMEAASAEALMTGRPLAHVLISRGAISENAMPKVQSYVLGVPFVRLTGESIPREALALIPEPVARAHSVISYAKDGDRVEIALLDMRDLEAVSQLRTRGLTLHPRLTDTEGIKHALLQYQKLLKEEFGDVIAAEAAKMPAAGIHAAQLAEEPSVIRVVDALLRHAALQRAEDIHFEPLEQELLVRYRIGGTLRDAMFLPKNAAAAIVARLKLLAGLAPEEALVPQDGRFKMETEADAVSFRLSTIPTSYGEKAVLRVLRKTGEGFTLDTLGLHGEALERVHRALREHSGLILVTGETGSGKTTMLYTLLDILNTPHASIATIEDPIEYRMKRVSQSQTEPKLGFTFAEGVRALMRQDADVIMVGDIRDEETASLAVSAASAGRLVLAGIRAPSAAEALSSLVKKGADPEHLASTVRLVIGNGLLRKLASPKETYMPSREELVATVNGRERALVALKEERLLPPEARIQDLSFYRPVSSDAKNAYRHHVGIHEALFVSSGIRELIREGRDAADIEDAAKREGMFTLSEDAIYMAALGVTSLTEASSIPS